MISFLISAIIVILMISFFVQNLKRKRTIRIELRKFDIKGLLQTRIAYFEKLNGGDKVRFEDQVKYFLDNVNIEGVGVEVTDADRVMVAASAVIPIFGFPDWRYTNLTNVILYPDTFNKEFQFEKENSRNILGMVGTGYMNGQMILSRAALMKGFSKNGGKENAAIHEFVHLIDGSDGAIDGMPEISGHPYAGPWLQMMHKEMNRIKENHSDIDLYATTNEAEFLAVTSEYFFEKPEKFKEEHPELYEQLAAIFSQQPADKK